MDDRFLRGSPAGLMVTFTADGEPIDADGAVTVTITKADGTVVVEDAATTHGAVGSGEYNYTFTAQANLNQFAAAWSGTFSGNPMSVTTEFEVVGGFIFTLAELRARPAVSDVTRYPIAELIEKRLATEEEFSDICQRSFVPRFGRQKLSGTGGTDLRVAKVDKCWPEILTVTKLMVDGTSWLSSWTDDLIQVADEEVPGTLRLVDGNTWPLPSAGARNIEIEYEFGLASVPRLIHDAALKRAENKLVGSKSTLDERATAMATNQGTFTLATPGKAGAVTAIPEIDVILARWGLGSDFA